MATPEWVAVSEVSPAAHSLYCKILMANQAGIAVSADVLARMMHFSRADKISQYVTELKAIGAVEVSKSGVPCRNQYRAVTDPPPGYAEATSFLDWLGGEQLDVVYYAQRATDDAIKIGYTEVRVSARMITLRRSFGSIRLLATEPGGQELETRRHREFFRWWIPPGRSNGHGRTEWFRPVPELLAHVSRLSAGAR